MQPESCTERACKPQVGILTGSRILQLAKTTSISIEIEIAFKSYQRVEVGVRYEPPGAVLISPARTAFFHVGVL